MKKQKQLGLPELIAIALGGMVGGGIFTILGISVGLIGNFTPIAIIIGGITALLAAYSYVKLGLLYRTEGATYSFFKLTYPKSHYAASVIGWLVIFGYISTIALYAYTFSSYALSDSDYSNNIFVRKTLAIGVIALFAIINVISVNGMGKIEDLMVYTKLILLTVISFILMQKSSISITDFLKSQETEITGGLIFNVLIIASITFVAFEGFQLVINAVNEMKKPEKNIPRAIYSAIFLAISIYVIISLGAIMAIPTEELIKNKEYALASGAKDAIGSFGSLMVILGALLATSSAISGTLFGSSRQLSVVADDGYLPSVLAKRKNNIPIYAILTMAIVSSLLIVIGGLQLILEFGSITFLFVSLLMAIANFKVRKESKSSTFITLCAIFSLSIGGLFILYYELNNSPLQLIFIIGIYIVLAIMAKIYALEKSKKV